MEDFFFEAARDLPLSTKNFMIFQNGCFQAVHDVVDEVGLIKIHNPQKLICFLADTVAAGSLLLSAPRRQVSSEAMEIDSVFFVVL